MKNKLIVGFLVLLNLVLLTNQFLIYRAQNGFLNPTYLPVLGNVGTRLLPIREGQVKAYLQSSGDKKEQLQQQITRITLQNLGLEQWLQYPDLKIIIKEGNVYPLAGTEVFVAISAGKDNGVLAVYGKGKKNDYNLIDKISNLVPVTDLAMMTLPNRNLKALVIQEYLDERFGAFFETSTITIFAWKKTLQKVWEGSKFYEAVWNEQWEGKKPRWVKVKESTRVRLLRPGQLQTVKETQFWQAPDSPNFPPSENYKLVKKTSAKKGFRWDNEKFKFIPSKS